jgi:hypothetical protein
MDHGILNVPLSKRGNIDQQIDRHKREQAAEAKAQRKSEHMVRLELVAQAKAHVEGLKDARLAELAVKFGMTVAQTKRRLLSEAFWQPKLILGIKA